jgi:hypothetical protein
MPTKLLYHSQIVLQLACPPQQKFKSSVVKMKKNCKMIAMIIERIPYLTLPKILIPYLALKFYSLLI